MSIEHYCPCPSDDEREIWPWCGVWHRRVVSHSPTIYFTGWVSSNTHRQREREKREIHENILIPTFNLFGGCFYLNPLKMPHSPSSTIHTKMWDISQSFLHKLSILHVESLEKEGEKLRCVFVWLVYAFLCARLSLLTRIFCGRFFFLFSVF